MGGLNNQEDSTKIIREDSTMWLDEKSLKKHNKQVKEASDKKSQEINKILKDKSQDYRAGYFKD